MMGRDNDGLCARREVLYAWLVEMVLDLVYAWLKVVNMWLVEDGF